MGTHTRMHMHTHTHTHTFNPRPIQVYTPKSGFIVFHHDTFVFFPEGKVISHAYSLKCFYVLKAYCVLVSLVKDEAINM